MSQLLYNALQTPSLKEVINDLRKVCEKLEIDFFGIGALARNIWYLANEEEARGTGDVDFAVYVLSEKRVINILTKTILKQSRLAIYLIENSLKETEQEKNDLFKQ